MSEDRCTRCGGTAWEDFEDGGRCINCGYAPLSMCEPGMTPEPCPMGCGRTTVDVYGGPCSACWQAT